MAWQGDVGKHQYRKQASAAMRSNERRDAMMDAADPDTPPKKARKGQKPYGLKLFWHSIISGRETWHIAWYETEEDRAKGRAHAEKELTHKRTQRFTRFEELER